MMSLKRLQSVGLLGFITMALFACAPPPPLMDEGKVPIVRVQAKQFVPYKDVTIEGVDYRQSQFSVGKFGGTFYDSSSGGGPKTFNPLAASDALSSSIAGLMFMGLAETDPYTGETVPSLAKTITVKPDNKTYVVTLRKGLQWSDGHALTADDVAFTWNRIILEGLGNPSSRDVLAINGQLPTVTQTGPLTIVFKTPTPFAPFKGNLGFPILPKHIVAPVIQNNPKAFDSFWGVSADPKSFVVNGPFILKQYISGQRVVLTRNPHFYQIDTQGRHLPYLNQYVMEFMQDQNAEVLQFEQGRIDSLGVPGSRVFYMKHLTTPPFILYDRGPTTSTSFLVLNQNPRKNKRTGQAYVNPIQSAWFRDIHFRRAIDWAIHRQELVENSLAGVGAPLYTAESLSSIFLNSHLAKGHPRDMNRARALLKQSGFYWNKAGQLFDKNHHSVEFELITNTGKLERESVGVAIKADLAELGMKVNFKAIDFNILVGKMDSCDWQAVILGLTGSPIEPNGGKNVWDSHAALHLFNQRKPGQDIASTDFIDPYERELDALFNQGAVTLDKNKRKQIYWRYQQVAYDNLPFIYLYSPIQISAVRTRLKNVDPTPLELFHNLPSLWVEP